MIETNRVVVHLEDGQILKGTAQDFVPNRPTFRVLPVDGGESVEIRCDRIKAVFFVKSYTGDPTRRDLRAFIAGPPQSGKGNKIAVWFNDGELLMGYSMNYTPDRDAFVVFPADPRSNNLRVYVSRAATTAVATGPAANALVEKIQNSGKAC